MRVDLVDYKIKITDNLEAGMLAQVNNVKFINGWNEFKHVFYLKIWFLKYRMKRVTGIPT